MEAFTWFAENWTAVLEAIGLFLVAASAVTKLTPTPKDDEWVRKATSFFSFLKHKDQEGVFKAPLRRP